MNDNLPTLPQDTIQNKIFTIRNTQVIVDRDLAELYNVSTKVLNQAVKRNSQRFPDAFRFQLTDNEKTEPVTICDRFIIDSATVYHFGASLKDLGKKWFDFSKMDIGAVEMIGKLGKIV